MPERIPSPQEQRNEIPELHHIVVTLEGSIHISSLEEEGAAIIEERTTGERRVTPLASIEEESRDGMTSKLFVVLSNVPREGDWRVVRILDRKSESIGTIEGDEKFVDEPPKQEMA